MRLKKAGLGARKLGSGMPIFFSLGFSVNEIAQS